MGNEKTFKRVSIMPCMGLMTPTSNLTRNAAFKLIEDRMPGLTLGLCIPALLRGVPEDVDMIEEYPVVVIDGCPEKCGSGIMSIFQVYPAARIYVPEVVAETKLKPPAVRQHIPEEGLKVVEALADRLEMIIKDILEDPDYTFEKQPVTRDGSRLANYDINPDTALNYIKIAKGFYRPSNMPKIRCLECSQGCSCSCTESKE